MFKILIVDDEIWVRNALSEQIHWNQLEAELAGTARNGEQALSMALELEPDIVITDIKMPLMDGLMLMESLKQHLPFCKIVIISGYSEFELVKQAMLYQAVDYVLKPIDADELNDAISRAIGHLKEDQKTKLGLLALKEKHFNALFDNPRLDESLLSDTLAHLNLTLTLGQYQVLEVAIDDNTKDTENYRGTHLSPDQFLNRLLDENLTPGNAIAFCSSLGRQQFTVLCGYPAALEIYNLVRQIINELDKLTAVLEELSIPYRIGVGLPHPAADITASRHEADYACQYLLNHNRTGIEFYDGIQQKKIYMIARITAFIDTNYAQPLTLDSVARQFYLSPSYLSRYFKSQMGENFVDYLTRIRMEHAIQLMKTTTLMIHEVARLVGYENINYFSKLFKRVTGKSPREFRQ